MEQHDPTYGLMDHPQNWGLAPSGDVMLIRQHWDNLIITIISKILSRISIFVLGKIHLWNFNSFNFELLFTDIMVLGWMKNQNTGSGSKMVHCSNTGCSCQSWSNICNTYYVWNKTSRLIGCFACHSRSLRRQRWRGWRRGRPSLPG